ncbi:MULTISPECIES: hypothetical protein [Amycolatopsis]|nr:MULTISPECIES: hypothetical protein [Amycolatopsis]
MPGRRTGARRRSPAGNARLQANVSVAAVAVTGRSEQLVRLFGE